MGAADNVLLLLDYFCVVFYRLEAGFMWKKKKLAVELSTPIKEKCKLYETFSLIQKEYEGLESLKIQL